MNKTVIAVIVTAVVCTINGCCAGQMSMTDDMNREIAEMNRHYQSKYKDSLDTYKQYVFATENLFFETQILNGLDTTKHQVVYDEYLDAFNKVSEFVR